MRRCRSEPSSHPWVEVCLVVLICDRFVLFTSGTINVTLPHSSDYAVVRHDRNAIVVAVDTIGTGHISKYPSDSITITYQLPFKGGIPPSHAVLYEGPCKGGIVEYA